MHLRHFKIILFSDLNILLLVSSAIQPDLSKASLKFFQMRCQDPLFFSAISEKRNDEQGTGLHKTSRSTCFHLLHLTFLLLLPCETRTRVHPRDSSFVSKIPGDLLPRWLALLPRRDGVMACNEKKKKKNNTAGYMRQRRVGAGGWREKGWRRRGRSV